MSFPIRPGKVTCAGLVAILMVLPNSIWKGPDAKAPIVKPRKVERPLASVQRGVKVPDAPR